MARKVDEAANFVFVQLIEQQPGIYDKRHTDYARQDKIDLAWERISHEIKESGSRLCSFETILYAIQFNLSQKTG
jgi:inosine/xanthosine triphosphate pyrophosphatase family protein